MPDLLVIDDDPIILNNLKEILTTVGFEVATTDNAEAGLNLIKKKSPDLILCDVAMPGMDGYKLLEKLQNDTEFDSIPFIFLTGNSDSRDIRRGMESGADDYLFKPFSIDYLVKAINTRLEKSAKLKKQSEDKLKELRENISFALPHEINTPLNGIGTSAQLLKDFHNSLTTEEIEEIADIILKSTKRLSHLVENFLLYAGLELVSHDAKKIAEISNHENAQCNLKNSLTIVSQQLSNEYNRESDLLLEIDSDVIIKIAENNFEKICEELIDNAFKYSQPQGLVKIISTQENNLVKISIINRGKGIKEEDIKKVGAYMQFERKKHEQQGIGLGLAICQKIVEIYGGKLMINSTKNQETKVDVTLPLIP